MGARELVVLGTASQVPRRTRSHQAVVLRWDRDVVLLDPGVGTQRQLTLARVAAGSTTRICITHLHGDHCLGLPGAVKSKSVGGGKHRRSEPLARSRHTFGHRTYPRGVP